MERATSSESQPTGRIANQNLIENNIGYSSMAQKRDDVVKNVAIAVSAIFDLEQERVKNREMVYGSVNVPADFWSECREQRQFCPRNLVR